MADEKKAEKKADEKKATEALPYGWTIVGEGMSGRTVVTRTEALGVDEAAGVVVSEKGLKVGASFSLVPVGEDMGAALGEPVEFWVGRDGKGAPEAFRPTVADRARRVWAGVGGLGPPPEQLVRYFGDDNKPTPGAVEWAAERAEHERHDLRTRLLVSAVGGVAAQLVVRAGGFPHSSSLDATRRAAIGFVDATLDDLEAEARREAGLEPVG